MNENQYSSLALAFIGDAHYNMTVKRFVIDREVKADQMQKHASRYISAVAQARFAAHLLDSGFYTERETEIFKRARNTKSHKAPKNTDVITYHVSTGFEAVWGYWVVNEQWNRIRQTWDTIRMLEGE